MGSVSLKCNKKKKVGWWVSTLSGKVTCPLCHCLALVEDDNVSSFAVVVGCKSDHALEGSSLLGSRAVDEWHPIGSHMGGIYMN